MKLSFDGFGVNGPDVYASRVATLTPFGHEISAGPLLGAAGDMLDALDQFDRAMLSVDTSALPIEVAEAIIAGRAAIAKARGKTE
jgi:hypothetical protein